MRDLALIILDIITMLFKKSTIIQGPSMEPTLFEGEMYYLNKAKNLKIGDIVVAEGIGSKGRVVKRITKITQKRNMKYYNLFGDNKNNSRNFVNVPESYITYKLGKPLHSTIFLREMRIDGNK